MANVNPAQERQLREIYARILAFALITKDKVYSLGDIIDSISNNSASEELCTHLGLSLKLLQIMQEHMNPYYLGVLNSKIEINNGILELSKTKEDMVKVAERRLSGFPTDVIQWCVSQIGKERKNETQ